MPLVVLEEHKGGKTRGFDRALCTFTLCENLLRVFSTHIKSGGVWNFIRFSSFVSLPCHDGVGIAQELNRLDVQQRPCPLILIRENH